MKQAKLILGAVLGISASLVAGLLYIESFHSPARSSPAEQRAE